MSMEPWGQPEPPETTLAILKDDGEASRRSTGLANESAARAREVNVYFMMLVFGLVVTIEGVWSRR
jgi:hypothetical protein